MRDRGRDGGCAGERDRRRLNRRSRTARERQRGEPNETRAHGLDADVFCLGRVGPRSRRSLHEVRTVGADTDFEATNLITRLRVGRRLVGNGRHGLRAAHVDRDRLRQRVGGGRGLALPVRRRLIVEHRAHGVGGRLAGRPHGPSLGDQRRRVRLERRGCGMHHLRHRIRRERRGSRMRAHVIEMHDEQRRAEHHGDCESPYAFAALGHHLCASTRPIAHTHVHRRHHPIS